MFWPRVGVGETAKWGTWRRISTLRSWRQSPGTGFAWTLREAAAPYSARVCGEEAPKRAKGASHSRLSLPLNQFLWRQTGESTATARWPYGARPRPLRRRLSCPASVFPEAICVFVFPHAPDNATSSKAGPICRRARGQRFLGPRSPAAVRRCNWFFRSPWPRQDNSFA